jgi:hypothetical protein
MAIEEHGAGKQMLLFHLHRQVNGLALAMLFLFGVLSAVAFFNRNLWFGAAFGMAVLLVLLRVIADCSVAGVTLHRSVESLSRKEPETNQGVSGVVYLGWS